MNEERKMTVKEAEEQLKVANEKGLCPLCLKPKEVCYQEAMKRKSWLCEG